MKKKFLTFPRQALKFTSRRTGIRDNGNRSFRLMAYKSDAPTTETEEDEFKADPNDSEEVQSIKRIGHQVGKFEKLLGSKANKEEFTNLNNTLTTLQTTIDKMKADDILQSIKEINEANAKIWKQIAEIQEETQKEKEKSSGSASPKGVFFTKEDSQKFIDATFKDGKKTHEQVSISLKAAETMGMSVFFNGGADTQQDAFTGRVIDPTLYQRRRKKNLILDNFTIGSIAVPKLLFLVKIEDGDDAGSSSGDAGGADWILSSEAKPKRSFRVTTGEAEAKKVAIFGTVEDKLLKDVSSLQNWLNDDFRMEMREKINDGLLNNDTGVNPKAPQGMKQDAVQYEATDAYDGTIDDPNYIDAIFAIRAFFSHNKESLDRVIISGDVYARIMHLKDADGRYQNNNLVYVNSIGQLFIGGILVVEADDEDVPATHILAVGADLGFKMLAYGPLVFERGLNGEDFRYDRTSYRGYQEFLTYLPTHRENSVMYDTWANIWAAITAASV